MGRYLRHNTKLLPFCHLRVRGWIRLSLELLLSFSKSWRTTCQQKRFLLTSYILVTVLFLFSLQILHCLVCSGSFCCQQMDNKWRKVLWIVLAELSIWVSNTSHKPQGELKSGKEVNQGIYFLTLLSFSWNNE